MKRFISLLSSRKCLGFIVLVAYYVAVVLPHNEVGSAINASFASFSRGTYNAIVAVGFAIISLLAVYYAYKQIPTVVSNRTAIVYLSVMALLVFLCFTLLMVINIEAIHFIQYAILAIFLYALLGNYQDVLVWAVLLGALDEAYQYLILENSSFYYDFNDVVLDTVGAAIGLLVLRFTNNRLARNAKRLWYKRPVFYVPITLGLVLLILYFTGHFSTNYISEPPAYFTLFQRSPPAGFWFYPMGPYARFHILTPIPALIIIGSIVLIYSRLEKL